MSPSFAGCMQDEAVISVGLSKNMSPGLIFSLKGIRQCVKIFSLSSIVFVFSGVFFLFACLVFCFNTINCDYQRFWLE